MSDDPANVVSIPRDELDHLRERLADAESHRNGLLEHSRNLEHLLSEKDSDLKQTQKVLEHLEARCYRYEQMLQEYGVHLGDPKHSV